MVLGLLGLALSSAAPARPDGPAQEERESRLRTVRGTVVDKDDTPLAESVVYLKNLKNSVVRTAIANDHGTYRFSGLDPNVDYEIHAEHKDSKSATRTVSSYDSRREIVIQLKVSKKK